MEIEVFDALQRAYRKFLINDAYLIEANANERTMTHKYAEYLQQEFPSWHVDCEYNRAKDDSGKDIPKTIYGLSEQTECKHRVYPDIIVHHRGTSDNFIVIEAKKLKAKKTDIEFDRLKIVGYMDEHAYGYAFLLTFTRDLRNFIKPIQSDRPSEPINNHEVSSYGK